jgi:kynurenine 3-monooxygenase
LNRLLLDELDQQSNVQTKFECKVNRVDKNGAVTYTENNETHTLQGRFVVGADGAYSVVRSALQRLSRVDYSLQYIKHGYKELTIPATADGKFALANPHGLHIWPRHEFMLIALPNPDCSFTCTLFAPFEGHDGLDSIGIDSDERIMAYFRKYFPDVIPLMPDLLTDYKTSPSSALLTVKASPWVYSDKVVILGDAAHACVPFYGQGMNAGFEDALVFDELFTEYQGDDRKVLSTFNEIRVPTGHAIAELSLENYIEMRSKTASPLFVTKKKIEKFLNWVAPTWWVPQYTMVAFTRTPYHIAQKKGKRQDQILNIALATTALTAAVAAVIGITATLLSSSSGQKTSDHQHHGGSRLRFPAAKSYYSQTDRHF